jgi:hypothetical protein
MGPSFNVEAVTASTVGSVQFKYNGNNFKMENAAPYAFCGNDGPDFNNCSEFVAGTHSITATVYSQGGGGGTVLSSMTVTFTITSPPVAPTPPSPVSSPVNSSPTTDGLWVEITSNAPIENRHEACFVMVTSPQKGRKAYLVGGRGTKRTDIYDPVARTWSVGATPPIQIHHMQCESSSFRFLLLPVRCLTVFIFFH